MLPFILKIADWRGEHLHHVNAENQNMDVDVQIELYSREVNAERGNTAETRRQMFQEITENAYQAFIEFLQEAAAPEGFLPFDLLAQYPCRKYCLILSAARSHELLEIRQRQPNASQSVLHYGDYELEITARRQLLDTAAYLVAQKKYTLFVRQVREANTIHVYRSSFMNLTQNTPPPLILDAREIIESVQLELAGETEQALPIEQLLMFPPNAEETNANQLPNCPECGGRVKSIGREGQFCLECNWDNLPPLK